MADCQVLCISAWHSAVDARSSVKLAKRLAQYYRCIGCVPRAPAACLVPMRPVPTWCRALAAGEPVSGTPLQAGVKLLHSPEAMKEALADE